LWRTTIYAIIETGGKQYKVNPGQTVDVERLDVAEGGTVEFDKVLFIGDGDRLVVGTPTVSGAKVVATVQSEGKGDKIIVYRYKSKTRYHLKTGHRQIYTRLIIDRIVEGGAVAEVVKPKRVRQPRKKEVTESGT
jgi:large subunit ribosomal protein L21